MYKNQYIQCRFSFRDKFDTVEPYQESFYKLDFLKTEFLYIFWNEIKYYKHYKLGQFSSEMVTQLWQYKLGIISKEELLNRLEKL